MTKQMTDQVSVFIAERATNKSGSDQKNLAWRQIAVYEDSQTQNTDSATGVFRPVKESAQTESSSYAPEYAGETLVARVGQSTASDTDLQRADDLMLYEVLSLAEFKNAALYDPDSRNHIHRIMNEVGFSVFKLTQRNFERGNAGLILEFPSNNPGDKTLGLLIDNTVNLVSREFVGNPYYVRTKLHEADLANPNVFTESLPIIDLTNAEFFRYRFSESTAKDRRFLATPPEIIDSFPAHSAKEFAPIFFQRALDSAKSSIILSNGKPLLKKDISAICDALIKAAKDEDGKLAKQMRFQSVAVTADMSIALQELMHDIADKLEEEPAFVNDVRTLLWRDEGIKAKMLNDGKEAWLKESAAERDKVEKDIAAKKAELKKLSLMDSKIAEKEKELKDIDDQIRRRQEGLKQVDDELTNIAAKYRDDMSLLIQNTGVGSMDSFLIYGDFVESKVDPSVTSALEANLALLLPQETAAKAAENIYEAIETGAHLCFDGALANTVANMLSISAEGKTASSIVVGGDKCSLSELMRQIQKTNTDVVVVEGVYGVLPLNTVLGLARHTKNKLLIFSEEATSVAMKTNNALNAHILRIETVSTYDNYRNQSVFAIQELNNISHFDNLDDEQCFYRDPIAIPMIHRGAVKGYTRVSESTTQG